MVQVSEPVTGVAVAPTVVTCFDAASWAENDPGADLPATVILRVTGDLQAVACSGQVAGSLTDVMAQLAGRVIPAFRTEEENEAAALEKWLHANPQADAFIMSARPDLVRRIRQAFPLVRGVIDYRKSALSLHDMRLEANSNLARIVIMPQQLATRDHVLQLQRLFMTVWVWVEPRPDLPASVNHYNLVVSGANGIVTADPAELISVLGSAFPRESVTLVRKPLLIGHRGSPELAPENTLPGALLAYRHGADLIENDVHLSADGEVMIHHDETLERTTSGSGPLTAHTLEQLLELTASNRFPDGYPDVRIPTLRQYLQEFATRDMVHVTEIKTGDPAVVQAVLRLVRELAAEDQVVFISFQHDQLARLQAGLPGTSVGCLTFGQMNEDEPLRSLRLVLEMVQPLNATYNPHVAGLGPRFLEAAKHRGVTVWPWTFREYGPFEEAFLAGVNGLTTDLSHWSSDWIARVSAPGTVRATVGEPGRLTARVSSYDRQTVELTAEPVVLAGHELVSVTDDSFTFLQPGTAWVAARVWQETDAGRGYFMNSEAVRIEAAP